MKLLWPTINDLFYGSPILVGDGWSLSMTLSKWRVEKRVDSIGRYVKIGPILFEYAYVRKVN